MGQFVLEEEMENEVMENEVTENKVTENEVTDCMKSFNDMFEK